jgi:hypothetical protein
MARPGVTRGDRIPTMPTDAQHPYAPRARGVAASRPPKAPDRQQVRWLSRGLGQPGGKLPLFDEVGRRVNSRLVRTCLKAGWAEPWFRNPTKPDWEVCRLTDSGRTVLAAYAVVRVDFSGNRPGRLT